MKIELRDELVNGSGEMVYSVSVISFDGEPLGVAIWLADGEEHLQQQLIEEFIHADTWDENIAPEWRAELIGKTLN